MDGSCTGDNCQDMCCRSWEQYLRAELSKLGGLEDTVLGLLQNYCPEMKANFAKTVPAIVDVAKTYYKNYKGLSLLNPRNVSKLTSNIKKICDNQPSPPPPPAADISQGMLGGCAGTRYGCCADGRTSASYDNDPCKNSQGGMLGGIVRDSRCASGYAVSGTNNPNTGRPYCTQ
jgi:hypothetical protein